MCSPKSVTKNFGTGGSEVLGWGELGVEVPLENLSSWVTAMATDAVALVQASGTQVTAATMWIASVTPREPLSHPSLPFLYPLYISVQGWYHACYPYLCYYAHFMIHKSKPVVA